jgi:hypothetical protein
LAGPDRESAVVAAALLSDFDRRVRHNEVAISISRPPDTLDTSIGAYLNCAAVPLKPLGNILVFTAFLTAERRGALCVQLFLCFCR